MKAAWWSGCVLCVALGAQRSPPPIPPELRARYGFVGPRIAALGEGVEDLRVCDIDGDGRAEALVSDPRRARILVLRHAAGASAAAAANGEPIVQVPVPTDGQIAGYGVCDCDGDRKAELLLVDGRGRLHVRRFDGARSDRPVLDLGLGGRGVALAIADLDGDGKQDALAWSRLGMRVVTRLAGDPVLGPLEPADESFHDVALCDVDGDRKPDLVLVVAKEQRPLRWRRGNGDGTFGPWLLFERAEVHDVVPVREAGGAALLATIEGPHRRVVLHALGEGAVAQALEWFALPDAKSRTAAPFVVADADGDGAADVVVALPDQAKLVVLRARGGTLVQRSVPSLSGVASLAAGDVDRDGKPDLVLASPEEGMLAWKSGKEPLDAFPARLACTGVPVSAAVLPDGGVLVLCRNERREAHLDRVLPAKEPERLLDVGRLPADPQRLLIGGFSAAAALDAAFVVPGEGLRVVRLPAPGAQAETRPARGRGKDKDADESAGFTRKIEDGAVSVVDADGRQALLVVRERFARTIRFDDEGRPTILAQDPGPEGVAELSLAATLADGSRVFLDKKGGKLHRVGKGASALSVDVPSFEFAHVVPFGSGAVLIGRRGVLRVPFARGACLEAAGVHEPPTEKTTYWLGRAGDFDGDGRADLALLDNDLHGVQILTREPKGLVRCLAFPVFEAHQQERDSYEPHGLEVGDFDGDGHDDLFVLSHDRVLIYLQER